MTHDSTLSRRDWFRLRARQPAAGLGSEDEAGLQPVQQPPNHDGMDLSQLPPVHEAILSSQEVKSLFGDIDRYATQIQLMCRQSEKSESSQRLADVCDRLIAGQIRRIQLRYAWNDAFWIDTLETAEGGFRIVRIRHLQQH